MRILGEDRSTLPTDAGDVRRSGSNVEQRAELELGILRLDLERGNRMENGATWNGAFRWFVRSVDEMRRADRSSTNVRLIGFV